MFQHGLRFAAASGKDASSGKRCTNTLASRVRKENRGFPNTGNHHSQQPCAPFSGMEKPGMNKCRLYRHRAAAASGYFPSPPKRLSMDNTVHLAASHASRPLRTIILSPTLEA